MGALLKWLGGIATGVLITALGWLLRDHYLPYFFAHPEPIIVSFKIDSGQPTGRGSARRTAQIVVRNRGDDAAYECYVLWTIQKRHDPIRSDSFHLDLGYNYNVEIPATVYSSGKVETEAKVICEDNVVSRASMAQTYVNKKELVKETDGIDVRDLNPAPAVGPVPPQIKKTPN